MGMIILGILIGILLRGLYDAIGEELSYEEHECTECGLVIKTEKGVHFMDHFPYCPECGGRWEGITYIGEDED